ncbi:hypothetical protein AB0N09_37925 [Streptomyces erythrochromogenes]|uniref:hypothetical protein n=1 Tax=Streptomyces erythrochromogenes TaxID=285574 RepID=UPI00343B3D3D
MRFVLLGHGHFDAAPGALPPGASEWVAIPQGITLRFFSDAGQGLVLGHTELGMWDQLTMHMDPLDSTNVVYNFTLSAAWDKPAFREKWQLGEGEPIRPGVDNRPEQMMLCTGNPGPCPTNPEEVANNDTHHCDGILGLEEFQNSELLWVACTGILHHADETVIAGALEGMPNGVRLGNHPDQIIDLNGINYRNHANITKPTRPVTLDYWVAGPMILIGPGHDQDTLAYMAAQHDFHQGTCQIDLSFGHRVATFPDLPPERRGFVDSVFRTLELPGIKLRWSLEEKIAELKIAEVNERNLNTVKTREELHYYTAGSVILIGPGHDQEIQDHVAAQADFLEGACTVFDLPGQKVISFQDLPGDRHEFVRATIATHSPSAKIHFKAPTLTESDLKEIKRTNARNIEQAKESLEPIRYAIAGHITVVGDEHSQKVLDYVELTMRVHAGSIEIHPSGRTVQIVFMDVPEESRNSVINSLPFQLFSEIEFQSTAVWIEDDSPFDTEESEGSDY